MVDAVLIVVHVLVALASTVTLALTAGYAVQAARQGATSAVVQYFSAASSRVGRVLYLVPVFGVVLIALNRRGYGLDQLWLWSSFALWGISAALAQTVVWPGEVTIATCLSDDCRAQDLRGIARQVGVAAAIATGCLVAGFPLMLFKPGAPGH